MSKDHSGGHYSAGWDAALILQGILLLLVSGCLGKEPTTTASTHLQIRGQADTLRTWHRERCMACYLLLGRFILEAGMLDVIGPDGLVLLILGAQVLHSLGDGQPTALNVLTADSGRIGYSALQGELEALVSRLCILSYTLNRHSLFCLQGNRTRQPSSLGERLVNSSL